MGKVCGEFFLGVESHADEEKVLLRSLSFVLSACFCLYTVGIVKLMVVGGRWFGKGCAGKIDFPCTHKEREDLWVSFFFTRLRICSNEKGGYRI
jgi:hypothetical protein